MSNQPILMTYGMTTKRVDDDFIEEVQDCLDDMLEDEWDMVVWRRKRSGTYMIVHATVECRSILNSEPELQLKVIPVGHLLDDYKDSRNEWLMPSNPRKQTPFDRASELIDQWVRNMWPDDIDEEDTVKPSKGGNQSSYERKPIQRSVMEMFGLDQVSGSDDEDSTVFTFSSSQK